MTKLNFISSDSIKKLKILMFLYMLIKNGRVIHIKGEGLIRKSYD